MLASASASDTSATDSTGLSVVPDTGSVQPPSPSALPARTRSWYWVLADRPVTVADTPVSSWGPLDHSPTVPLRYWTS